MSDSVQRRVFTARPAKAADADAWVRAADGLAERPAKADLYSARLTIDVTPELRGRIKMAAYRRGTTVADMLRALLDQSYPAEREG